MPRRFAVPVRARLALLLVATVVVGGAALLALTHALVSRALIGGLLGLPPRRPLGRPPLPGRAFAPPVPAVLPTTPGALLRYREAVEESALGEMTLQSAVALGVIAVLSAAAGWFVAGSLLRPLQAVTAAARRLSQETLHERIRMPGPRDEIRDLADTFDDMLDRLERSFRSQRSFMANVSHEMRTPLTLQRTVIDVTLGDEAATPADLRDALRTVSDAVDQQRRLVEGLLVLAISERGPERRRPLELGGLVEDALAAARRDAGAAGVEVRSVVVPAVVEGDAVLLGRLFGNLLENAIRYNLPGGWVALSMELAGRTVRTVVSNTGPAVPEEQAAALFEPFRRMDAERTAQGGAGLGLSIVRAIAGAHRGTVVLRPRAEGGLEVTVDLPLGEGRSGR